MEHIKPMKQIQPIEPVSSESLSKRVVRGQKPLQRFARLLNCERVVQVVKSEGIYRQVKIDSRIYHVVSAESFLSWLP